MIPPYQAATEEIKRQAQNPKKLINTAAAVGTSLVGGSALAKVLPLLNQFIPADLMRKGLSKINPKIEGFINTALNNGYTIDDVRGFLSDKFGQANDQEQKSEQSSQNSVKSVNPLQDFETKYPDISKALMGYINQGQPPEAAAGILKLSGAFGSKIKNLEKEIGKNFVDYVLELFGSQQSQSNPMQQSQDPQQKVNQTQGQGGLDPQLMQLMQGIRSSIQNLRGS